MAEPDFIIKGVDSMDVRADKTNVAIAQAAIGGGGAADHIADRDNPHEVTKAQVGLDQVDNTSDADKPLSDATIAALAALGIGGTEVSSFDALPASPTGGQPVLVDTFGYVLTWSADQGAWLNPFGQQITEDPSL